MEHARARGGGSRRPETAPRLPHERAQRCDRVRMHRNLRTNYGSKVVLFPTWNCCELIEGAAAMSDWEEDCSPPVSHNSPIEPPRAPLGNNRHMVPQKPPFWHVAVWCWCLNRVT